MLEELVYFVFTSFVLLFTVTGAYAVDMHSHYMYICMHTRLKLKLVDFGMVVAASSLGA